MNLTYTPAVRHKNRNVFIVEVSYEHGDADSNNTYSQTLKCTEEEFKQYLERFELVKQRIHDARSSGDTIKEMESLCKVGHLYVPAELDAYAKMHMSDYYANMDIMHISWFDSEGNEFNVEVRKD